MPRVSVLMPTYNHGRLLGECLESLRAQTFTAWEGIVLDDGSEDDPAALVETLNDSRIRVLRRTHRGIEGLGKLYNWGLAEARGDLVAILEGDDLWYPAKLATQVPDFEDPHVALSAGRFDAIDEAGTRLGTWPLELPPKEVRENDPVGAATRWMLRYDGLTFAFPVTVVMRTKTLRESGGFVQPPELPLVDLPTLLPMGLAGGWRFHETPLAAWRRHAASITRSRFPAILNATHAHLAAFARDHYDRLGFAAGEAEAIEAGWTNFQLERLVLLGRIRARRGDRAGARKAFRAATGFGGGRATRAILGLAQALTPLGLTEWAFRVGRRPKDPEAQLAADLDPLVHAEMHLDGFLRHRFLP